MAIQQILSQLQKVKRTGDNKYLACCPAHDDKSPSLSLLETPDGRILVHCFAGCSANDVLAAVGLTLSDLYPDSAIQDFMKSASRKPKPNEYESILWVADEMRKRGQKLSKEGLEFERRAYMRARAQNEVV